MIKSVLDAVRAATLADHQRTEDNFASLLAGLPNTYASYLLVHAAAFPAVGRALAPMAEWTPWELRWIDLQADLKSLGLAPPVPLDIAPARTADEALGMIYVLEGSRMGGALILKSIPDDLPAAYLRGSLDVSPWKRLKDILAGAEPDRADGVVAGARTAFGAFSTAAHAHTVRAA